MELKESHNYDHTHAHHDLSTANIKIAVFLNGFFCIVEFFVGIMSRSVSISSNAIHDFGDTIILFFSLLLENKSKQGRSLKYTYGYRRFSLLGNLINTIILIIGGVIILQNAITRLYHPEEINGKMMLGFAILGIIVNGYGAYRLSKSTVASQRGIFLNIASDFISWIGILFSSIMVYFYNITIFDSIFSILLGLWLLFEGFKLTKQIFLVLMQAVPNEINLEAIESDIRTLDKIVDVHDFHVWNLDGEDYISSLHIVIDSDDIDECMEIKEDLKKRLETYGLNHTTIEVDNIRIARQNGELDEKTLGITILKED